MKKKANLITTFSPTTTLAMRTLSALDVIHVKLCIFMLNEIKFFMFLPNFFKVRSGITLSTTLPLTKTRLNILSLIDRNFDKQRLQMFYHALSGVFK